jgi:[ribosomal protein S5]-alanine N-acetyltransferase
MISIITPRLELIPTTLPLIEAELNSLSEFASMLNVQIPEGWPPGEYDRHAMEYFRIQLKGNPDAAGWFGWYALARFTGSGVPVLIGDGGFFGPPNQERQVEIGYSIVRSFERKGFATELVRGLVDYAFSSGGVDRIIAHTNVSNPGSIRVLQKSGFLCVGTEFDSRNVEYAIERVAP